jgi:hypothetical protein
MASFDDILDDEELLKLIQRRQEEAALRERAITDGNPMGRMIAGIAGGLEAGMTGGSGAQGAMRGMEYVDQNNRRIAAMQSAQDSKEMQNLVQIAKIRSEKAQQSRKAKDDVNRLYLQHDLDIDKERQTAPFKEAREMLRYAWMTGDKKMMIDAQDKWRAADQAQKDKQLSATMADRQADREHREKLAGEMNDLRKQICGKLAPRSVLRSAPMRA